MVVVAHSYGGVVASSAVEGLSKAARAQAGKPGGVIKVVYLAAFALDKGQSLLGMLGGNYLPWMKVEVSLKTVVMVRREAYQHNIFIHLDDVAFFGAKANLRTW